MKPKNRARKQSMKIVSDERRVRRRILMLLSFGALGLTVHESAKAADRKDPKGRDDREGPNRRPTAPADNEGDDSFENDSDSAVREFLSYDGKLVNGRILFGSSANGGADYRRYIQSR